MIGLLSIEIRPVHSFRALKREQSRHFFPWALHTQQRGARRASGFVQLAVGADFGPASDKLGLTFLAWAEAAQPGTLGAEIMNVGEAIAATAAIVVVFVSAMVADASDKTNDQSRRIAWLQFGAGCVSVILLRFAFPRAAWFREPLLGLIVAFLGAASYFLVLRAWSQRNGRPFAAGFILTMACLAIGALIRR